MQSTKRTVRTRRATAAVVNAAADDAVAGNDDLLEEILFRLPLKSLVRFKSVSKRWLSAITSPNFSSRRNPNPNLPSGLFLHRSEHIFYGGRRPSSSLRRLCYVPFNETENQISDPFTPISFFNDNPDIYILQSCNGLLCCGDSKLRSLYIVNPTTKQFRGPIQSKVHARALKCFGVCLAFDPSKSPHYKVICVRDTVFSSYGDNYYQIEIYSSETSTWRLSGNLFAAPWASSIQFSRGVFWNGAINWFSTRRDSLYFNVDQERLKPMPMPPMPPVPVGTFQYRKVRYFGESRGHLHLVEYNNPSVREFKIYEMERDYSSWFMKYSVDLDEVSNAFPELIRHYGDKKEYLFSIFRIVRRENGDESILVLNTPNKFISYNLKEKIFKKIVDFDSGSLGIEDPDCHSLIKFGWFNAYPYIESLSSV